MARMSLVRTATAAVTVPVVIASALVAGLAAPAAAAEGAGPAVVSETPRLDTPEVRNGRVEAIAQVGDVTVVGGTFTSITNRGGEPAGEAYVAAYDSESGRLSESFQPVLNKPVRALLPGPLPGTVFIGGDFTLVNDERVLRLTLLDLTTGERVEGFKKVPFNGRVTSLGRSGSRLLVGGTFTRVAGSEHAGLAALQVRYGTRLDFVQSQFTGHHNYGVTSGSARSPVGVVDLAITPDGTQLTAIGNFREVDGLPRDQVVVMDLSGPVASVREDWVTSWFTAPCYSWAFDYWVQDVDYSPDGEYFVIGSSGGGNKDLCDAVGRFETSATGQDIQPTWIGSTGGDSIFSLVATDAAIYVGGHFRWFNNPKAVDKAGAGAVPRAGIAALDPSTGMPLEWNPGRHPRDKGTFAMLATETELLVGSDTDWIGYQEYYTPKLVSFPFAGGQPARDAQAATLPGWLTRMSADATETAAITQPLASDGPQAESSSSTINVDGITGATYVDDDLWITTSDGQLLRHSAGENGDAVSEVMNPYDDPFWSTIDTGLNRGSTYEGVSSGFDVSLGSLSSLFFLNDRLYYTKATSSKLYFRTFESGTGATHPVEQQVSGVVLPRLAGGSYADGDLYYVLASDGTLMRQGFDGERLEGEPVAVGGPSVDGVDWRADALVVGPAAVVGDAQADLTISAPRVDALNQVAWTVRGSGQPESAVDVTVTDKDSLEVLAATTVDSDGTWTVSLDASALADGELTIAVTAAGPDETSEESLSVVKQALPQKPQITGTTSGADWVDVGFTAPEDTGGLPLDGFVASITADGKVETTELASSATSFRVNDLAAGREYAVSVAARTAEGLGAPAAVTLTTPTGEEPVRLRVLLTPDSTSVTTGDELTLSGSVTDRDTGGPLAGVPVTVFDKNPATGERTQVMEAVTLADGSFTVRLSPAASRRYQADVRANLPEYRFGRSAQTQVVSVLESAQQTVSTRLILTADTRTVAQGSSVTLSGLLSDKSTGAPLPGLQVKLFEKDPVTGARTVVATVVTDPDGRFVSEQTPGRNTRYQADFQAQSPAYAFSRSAATWVVAVK